VTRRGLLPLLVLAALCPVGYAHAQTPPAASPPRLTVSITAATVGYGDLQAQPVLAQRFVEEEDGTGGVEEAVLGRVVRVENGIQALGSIVLALDRWWSVRAGLGLGRLRLGQGYTGADAWVLEAAGVPVSGSDDVTLSRAEAAVRLRLPSAHTLRPYLEVGVGLERWQSRAAAAEPFPGAGGLVDGVARWGGHGAVGGSYPVTDRLAARAQASARVFRTPLAPAASGMEVGRTEQMVLTFTEPPAVSAAPFADASREVVQGLRLELGLSYSLGGVVPAPPDRSGSDGSPDAPPR
jgi:hypothetical protein